MRELVLLVGHGPTTPDLSRCAPCVSARALAPDAGGLSVEGAAHWAGALWLGLRSPLVEGKALLLRMEGDPAGTLSAAEVVPVDLGGLGVRELATDGTDLLVIAGPAGDSSGAHHIYRISAPGAQPRRLAPALASGTEGLASTPDGALLLVSDGSGQPGRRCKAAAAWRVIERPR
jgi:hypothetical protein